MNYPTNNEEMYGGMNSNVSYRSQSQNYKSLDDMVSSVSPARKQHNLNHISPVQGCSYCGF